MRESTNEENRFSNTLISAFLELRNRKAHEMHKLRLQPCHGWLDLQVRKVQRTRLSFWSKDEKSPVNCFGDPFLHCLCIGCAERLQELLMHEAVRWPVELRVRRFRRLQMSRSVVTLLLAAALAGTLFLVKRNDDPTAKTPTQGGHPTQIVSSASLSVSDAQTDDAIARKASDARLPEVSHAQKMELPPFMRAYAAAQGVRAFIDSALKRPEQGGLTYAYAAFEICFGDTYGPAGIPPQQAINAPQAGEARAKLLARCDMSAAERRDLMTARMAMRPDLLSADPYYGQLFQYLRDKTAAGALERLTNSLLGSQDIFAMYALLSLDPATLQASNGEGQYFGGQRFVSEPERRQLNDAYIYASCSYGAPCGPESSAALRLCAERGWCEGSVQSSLRFGYGVVGREAEFTRLAETMTLAFQNREARAFVGTEKSGS